MLADLEPGVSNLLVGLLLGFFDHFAPAFHGGGAVLLQTPVTFSTSLPDGRFIVSEFRVITPFRRASFVG